MRQHIRDVYKRQVMQSMDGLWWSSDSSDIMDAEEDNEESSDADTEDFPVTEDTQNGDCLLYTSRCV